MFQQIVTLNRTVGKEIDSFRFCIRSLNILIRCLTRKSKAERLICA